MNRVCCLSLLLASLACGEGFVVDHQCVQAEKVPKAWLDKARSLDVVFGHQSVGGNLVEGLSELADADAEKFTCTLGENAGADWIEKNHGCAHFEVGENEDPQSKIEDFDKRVREIYGAHVRAAMFKFCFVDLPEGNSDPKKVFESCRKTIEGLEKAFPKVRFVWWTCPLETEKNGAHNAYNRLVRDYCKANGKALFDLADIEGDGGQALRAEYSEDGGHLNEAGRQHVAKAWWWLMARLAGWDGK